MNPWKSPMTKRMMTGHLRQTALRRARTSTSTVACWTDTLRLAQNQGHQVQHPETGRSMWEGKTSLSSSRTRQMIRRRCLRTETSKKGGSMPITGPNLRSWRSRGWMTELLECWTNVGVSEHESGSRRTEKYRRRREKRPKSQSGIFPIYVQDSGRKVVRLSRGLI